MFSAGLGYRQGDMNADKLRQTLGQVVISLRVTARSAAQPSVRNLLKKTSKTGYLKNVLTVLYDEIRADRYALCHRAFGRKPEQWRNGDSGFDAKGNPKEICR